MTPLRVSTMKARISLVAVMEDGTKKTGVLEVDVKEIKTYQTSGGNLISLDGVLEKPLDLVSIADPTSN